MPSPFEFKRYGRNGVEVSELLPQLASVIDEMCVIRSMYTFNPTHTPARALFHTGSVLATRPSIGSWITYGLGTENQNLPAFVALGKRRGGPHDAIGFPAVRVSGRGLSAMADPDPEKIIPNLRNKNVDANAQRTDMDALLELNQGHAKSFGADQFLEGRIKSMETAYRMQFEAMDLFDIRKEPQNIRDEYGTTPFGNGCLLARRLVEAGVRFVNVDYPGGQIWDDHRDVNDNLRKRCPDMDQAAAALIRDLKRRGLLDETLVVWGGEFGRTPVSESGSGRDHNPYGFTMCVAGGGFKGGIAYGATDEFGFKAEREPRVDPRPARDDAQSARHGSHQADLPVRGPGFPPDRRVRRSREGHPCVTSSSPARQRCSARPSRCCRHRKRPSGRPCAIRSTAQRRPSAASRSTTATASPATCRIWTDRPTPAAGARGAPLVGTRFVQDFGESKVSALFNKMKRDMPSGKPGTLTDQAVSRRGVVRAAERTIFRQVPTELTVDTVGDFWIPGAGGAEGLENYTFVSGDRLSSPGSDAIVAADEARRS